MFSGIYSLTLSGLSSIAAVPTELTGELVAFILLFCFVGLSNWENRLPKIRQTLRQVRLSYQTNIGMFIFNNLLMSVCSISTLFLIADFYSSFGLLNKISNPYLKFILAFIAFDLMLYLWHQVCHRVDALWVFHRVHHNDLLMNVSTAFRLHFVEILITYILKASLMVVLGIDKMSILIIESVITIAIMFHHANTGFKYERFLGVFMIVPFLHRVHHSTDRSEHDSNYGAVFSVWDRLFGTLSQLEPKQIGIKGESPQDLYNLLKFGLGLGASTPVQPANLNEMIAEAAYYKAEKRNFYPGYEMRDWLDAKQDVLNIVCGDNARLSMTDNLKLMLANFNRVLKQVHKADFKQFTIQWH
jgi:sterol desaturase/sphingolipid hydroxylase (fatty acid hydroxylase superfamily)